jgi:hypothetical protein
MEGDEMALIEQQLSEREVLKADGGMPGDDNASAPSLSVGPVFIRAMGLDAATLRAHATRQRLQQLTPPHGDLDGPGSDTEHLLAATMLAAHAEHIRGA